MPLDDAPRGFQIFRDKRDQCTKIVLKPGMKREVESRAKPKEAPILH